MGLSSSQCRLLCLTSRLSDLEYQAQVVDDAKITLSNQSSAASKTYENAINQEKLAVYDSDTSSYVDASAYNLSTYGAVSNTDKQRIIVDSANRVLITTTMSTAYTQADVMQSYIQHLTSDEDGDSKITVKDFLIQNGLTYDSTTGSYGLKDTTKYPTTATTDLDKQTFVGNLVSYLTNCYTGAETFMNQQGYTSATKDIQASTYYQDTISGPASKKTYDASAASYYTNIYDQIAKNGYCAESDQNMQSSEWLYKEVQNGNLYLTEWNSSAGKSGTGDWSNISWSTGDSSLKTESDDTYVTRAKVAYDTTMQEIQAQDSKYDLTLDKINTEHSAIQTEMDSVKSIIGKNIERTYKTFSA